MTNWTDESRTRNKTSSFLNDIKRCEFNDKVVNVVE